MTPTAATNHNQAIDLDEDDDSLDSHQTKNGNHSRLGRKGDPRMHRAVAARLANPSLSLVEALRLGGFNYPETVNDDHYTLQDDTVSIGQRKNQLSRRCRLAKQQAHSGAESQVKKRKQKRKSQAQTELEQVLSMDPSGDFPIGDRGRKRELTLPEDDAMDEGDLQGIARQRMAKFHPQYHPIVVPQAHRSLGSLLDTNESSQALLGQSSDIASSAIGEWPAPGSLFANHSALADALRGPVTSNGSLLQSLNHSHSQQQSHPPSGVAVASLNATASSVGLTLEQLAVALSSTTNLAKVLADQSIPDMKQELALNLYRAECSTLYQRCMLLAGYDLEETQDTSDHYKQFAYKAWSAEGERLENQFGHMPTQLAASEQAPEKDPATSHDHASKCCDGAGEKCCGGSNEQDRACFDGRHVHRLEGKCGHKAIIHQPEGAPAHVDFLVNGKVECYEGIRPVGTNAALWPSRYNCEELDCPISVSSPHKVACACENECAVRVNTDPKEFHLSDINLDGKEWNQEFFENSTGNENSLAGLIQLGSEDGKPAAT